MDNEFMFGLPLWWLKSKNEDDKHLAIIPVEGADRTSLLFTDEDLANRFIHEKELGDLFRPDSLKHPVHVLIWIDFVAKNGVTHVAIDPKRTIATFYPLEQLRTIVEGMS